MGARKALQRLGSKSVVEHVLDRIPGFVDEIHVIVDDPDAYALLAVPRITDLESDAGPLMGLYTGIVSSKSPWVLAVACDTPFIEPGLIELILARPRDTKIIVREVGGQPQPLPALYSAGCRETVRSLLASGLRALRNLLET